MRWLSILFLIVALGSGAALWLQREAAAGLRDDLALLHGDRREIARLREENARLAAALPPAGTLEALRADRAAVARLRREIETTREKLETRERALAAPPAAAAPAPALKLAVGVDLAGQLSSNGLQFDPAAWRQQLAALPRGSAFEIRVQLPKAEAGASYDKVKQGVDAIAEHARQAAKDFGLKMSLRTERAQP
ncbi:MAG: hypothetical protein JNL39_01280 [Opitutaceae bacterium]|nr:hypothetical protein [Opitutaceae bacterium]